MSDIIEKTIASLPGLLAGAAGLTGDKPIAVSRAFQSFVNSLGSIHSKYVSHINYHFPFLLAMLNITIL